MELKKFNVTIRVFDPIGKGKMQEYVLPVDSPDAEHAASSTLANAISWTTKIAGDAPLSVAFQCIAVAER